MTGAESPPDDASIADDAVLLRLVSPVLMDRDGALSSNAFHDVTDSETGEVAMSVFLEAEIQRLGVSLDDMIDGMDGFGIVAITVGDVRALGMGVTWAPNALSHGEAHAHVNGDKTKKRVRRALAAAARPVLWPPPRADDDEQDTQQ